MSMLSVVILQDMRALRARARKKRAAKKRRGETRLGGAAEDVLADLPQRSAALALRCVGFALHWLCAALALRCAVFALRLSCAVLALRSLCVSLLARYTRAALVVSYYRRKRPTLHLLPLQRIVRSLNLVSRVRARSARISCIYIIEMSHSSRG